MKTLLLHEIGHTAVYFLLAIALTKALNFNKYPIKLIILGYLVTIGLDADHLIDYFMADYWSGFSLYEFIFGSYLELSPKTYVIFHAWEWVLLSIFFYFLFRKKYKFLLFIAAGIAAQLIFDTISYGFNWESYLITNRVLRHFDKNVFTSSYN